MIKYGNTIEVYTDKIDHSTYMTCKLTDALQ